MSTRFLLQTFSWESITRFSTACAAYEEPITRPTRICHTQLLANGRFLDSASGPALPCGNSVVLKTAEQTPLSARYAGNLFLEAGLLPGVLNIISGFGPAGAALCSHVVVDKLAITGSTAMGKTVLALAAASNLKPVTLEVGGKSIFIVCEDADVDKAVELVHFALFYNQGQYCGAGSRIYVHERVYDEYLEKAKARAVECVVGDSFKKDNILIAQDEIFGPVQSISKFRDIIEVIERANTASFGLAAGVLTHDVDVTTIWPVN